MELKERVEILKSGWWSPELFKEYTEFDPWWSSNTEFLRLFEKWGELRNKGNLIDETGISWIRFSQFCSHFEILPVKLQAIRFSMKAGDYERLLGRMREKRLVPSPMTEGVLQDSGFTGPMYQAVERYDIEKHLPPLKGEYVDFFERVRQTLGLRIRPLLGGRARCYDILTGKPLGNRGTVMLDFGHPLSIGYWSSMSYVKKHRVLLREYSCGDV